MTIVAMTREMGTLGKDVAAGLADALGIEVVHQELVEHHVAEQMYLGESTVHRFLEGRASLWERWKIDSERMSRYTAGEVLQLANKGDVLIRGWGSTQLLRDVSHVLCVRVCAPMPLRVVNMMERLGVSDERSMRLEIERNDNAHSQTIQRQFGGDWRDPTNYDIVLNTGFLTVKTCVALLQQITESGGYKETKQSRDVLADRVINDEVLKILDEKAGATSYHNGIDVTVEAGSVILAGVVSGHRKVNVNVVIGKIGKIEGVTDVTNNVTFVPDHFGV